MEKSEFWNKAKNPFCMFMRNGFTIYWLSCFLLVFSLSCQSQSRPLTGLSVLEPIPAIPMSEKPSEIRWNFSDLTASCSESQLNQGPDTPVKELLLVYANAGRDFMDPSGVDGYLLRVIPVNHDYQPARIKGRLSVYLYENPSAAEGDPKSTPIRVWQIPAAQLDAYWVKSSLLDGYTLPLDWLSPPPSDSGQYLFLVQFRVENKNGNFLICNTLNFQDVFNNKGE
jgi:hypothetical protein